MFYYEEASLDALDRIWDYNIASNPDEELCWRRWKEEYIRYHKSGQGKTFLVLHDREPVGEGTLLFHPNLKPVGGHRSLADSSTVAYVNALRIRKEFEGQGHISALVRVMEDYTKGHGYRALTIGVDAAETRNLAIYLHWGFRKFVMAEEEDGELVLYYRKEIS